jgi:hypothetical protein
MSDDKRRQECEELLKQQWLMSRWGIEDNQKAAIIDQVKGYLAQPCIPAEFDALNSYVNDYKKLYNKEHARKKRVRTISLIPDATEDPRARPTHDLSPGRTDVEALLAQSVERYALDERQKEVYRAYQRTGHLASYAAAKHFGVSRQRVHQLTHSAGCRALAGAFLTAAEKQSPEAADLVLSTQFALCGPFTAAVLNAYDDIANGLRKQTGDPRERRRRRDSCTRLDAGLPWLWGRAKARLFELIRNPDATGDDVCQIQPAFMALFIAARWGGKKYVYLYRDTIAEAEVLGITRHPVLARHLATIGAYCDDPARQMEFLGSDQCHIVEKTTTWLYLHGGVRSGLPYADIVRGRLDTTREQLRNKKRYSPKPAIDYTLRCLNNTRYRNDGLTGMVLTWADMLVADLDAATAQPLEKQLTKLANTLEHRRRAICETRGLTTTYTGVVDRLHWIRRDLAKNFLAQG